MSVGGTYGKVFIRLRGHRKTLGMSNEAWGVWVRAMIYAKAERTDGIVHREVFIHEIGVDPDDPQGVVTELVRRRLLDPSEDGWMLHDWDEHQAGDPFQRPEAFPEAFAEAGRRGGLRSVEVRREKYGSAQPPSRIRTVEPPSKASTEGGSEGGSKPPEAEEEEEDEESLFSNETKDSPRELAKNGGSRQPNLIKVDRQKPKRYTPEGDVLAQEIWPMLDPKPMCGFVGFRERISEMLGAGYGANDIIALAPRIEVWSRAGIEVAVARTRPRAAPENPVDRRIRLLLEGGAHAE